MREKKSRKQLRDEYHNSHQYKSRDPAKKDWCKVCAIASECKAYQDDVTFCPWFVQLSPS